MRSTLKKIVLLLTILLGGTEGGLRFFLGNFVQSSLVEVVDDPSLCFVLGKNRELSYTGWWGKVPHSVMESNFFGSREDRLSKNNKKQVFMLGDSFTYGQGVDQQDSLPAQIQVQIPELDIWNFGVPGRDFFQFSAELARLKSLKPDVVLINILANDFDLPPNTCMFSPETRWQLPVMRNCYICRLGLFGMANQNTEELPRNRMKRAIQEELQKVKSIAEKEDITLIIVFLTDDSTMIGEKTATECAQNYQRAKFTNDRSQSFHQEEIGSYHFHQALHRWRNL